MQSGETFSFQAKNSETIRLRPVEEKDAQDIIKHVETIIQAGRYLQKEKPRSLEEEIKFIQEVRLKNNMYTAVERNGKVVGIARVIKGELIMKSHTGIFRTWIHPDSQGLGIGKQVMNYTLEWGRTNQLHKLWLTVFSGNEKAVKVYEKSGFIIEGRQKNQAFIDGKFEDEIFMAYFFNTK
ncbi:GNAT family N-acetyltransferase [Fictibacillus phosphorivorans]|uniref:GNAT family N-acetyltransferase n=1 Tax=Fictibacillus phosphorivorans TaxID=1221500 RepID=UPI00203AE260|nr:GNAT family protein [Fictibacillus phosphorivorans]MCM3719601.1 GNAT family N-acetyltransferase [Fictibacillus phosphorivorans]MCM3777325.1 GNAT family N-acetyltransferase [Fictibacillus phosphorivorans]